MSAIAAGAMQSAFLERDFSLAAGHLADDVVFHSPVLGRPWETRAVLEELGPSMVALFDDVVFAPTVVEGRRAILSFSARCGDVAVQAIEVMDVDESGRVAEITIYVRPLPALLAVAKGMQARIDPQLLAEHVA